MSVYQQTRDAAGAAAIFETDRWNRALQDRLFVRNRLTSTDFGLELSDEFGAQFDSTALDPFLTVNARVGAESINAATEEQIAEALDSEDPAEALDGVFGILLTSGLDRFATSTVATSANFGMFTAADQAGQRNKVWVVNSIRPRAAHASMAGETVPLGEAFSNDMQWPGDPSGGADENANCQCSVEFEG